MIIQLSGLIGMKLVSLEISFLKVFAMAELLVLVL